jgi:ribose 5-phosphate isomerase B
MTDGLRIVIAADNAGIELKNALRDQLEADPRIQSVNDLGVQTADDARPYPDLGIAAANEVAHGAADRAVLVCGTGIGMAISANKVASVRAAVCHDSYSAERSIRSNNCQVLAMGARVVGVELAKRILDEWLTCEFDPESPSAAKVARINEHESAAHGGPDDQREGTRC